jgi:hypothetical protein
MKKFQSLLKHLPAHFLLCLPNGEKVVMKDALQALWKMAIFAFGKYSSEFFV